MTLCELLLSKMNNYNDIVVFPQYNITYKKLIYIIKNASKIKEENIIINDENKLEMSLKILKALNQNKKIIPISYKNNDLLNYAKENINRSKIKEEARFIFYTSGSTGIPKGVMLSDKNILNNIIQIDEVLKFNKNDKIILFKDLSHISSITSELIYALYCGCQIVFYNEEFMPQRIKDLVVRYDISYMGTTPTLLSYLEKYGIPTNLKKIIISGEIIKDSLINKLTKQKYNKIEFFNAYGMTECSPRISILSSQDFFKKPGSVGKALGKTLVKIQSGEITVKSNSIMLGYLNDKDSTNNKIKNKVLFTGDLGEIDDEGYIYVLGRKDDLIIRCGVNIYPKEIENKICDLNIVDDCVVYRENSDKFGNIICLKYVGNITVFELREKLISILPDYKIPNKIFKVEKFNKTVSGKKIL